MTTLRQSAIMELEKFKPKKFKSNNEEMIKLLVDYIGE